MLRIADLPAAQRPRERARNNGTESLNDAEVLALIIRGGTKTASALDLAYALLAGFGSIAALARADVTELAEISGIGQAKATALVAAFELSRRAQSPDFAAPFVVAQDVAAFVSSSLRDLRRERVVVVPCDALDRPLCIVHVSDGALDHSLLPVREILNAVIRVDGRGFALAHNHPSGDPLPSDADKRSTSRLRTAANLVGLRMLDHIVIAGDTWKSVD